MEVAPRAADRRMDRLDELFNGQWGKLIESLVEGDLTGLLQRRGIAIQHTVTNPRQNYGERRWEFDIQQRPTGRPVGACGSVLS